MKAGAYDGLYIPVDIPLATKPGIANVNGITYTKEAFIKALKEFTERTLYIEMGYPDKSCSKEKWYSVDLPKVIGFVNHVNIDGGIAKCTLYEYKYVELLDKLCLGLKYLGNVDETKDDTVTKMKIICCCLIEKPKVQLSSMYGESIKERGLLL